MADKNDSKKNIFKFKKVRAFPVSFDFGIIKFFRVIGYHFLFLKKWTKVSPYFSSL